MTRHWKKIQICLNVRLFLIKKYCIVLNIGNKLNKQMCVATLLWESEVVFMVNLLQFLIIGFIISITINITLLTVIYIICTNKE